MSKWERLAESSRGLYTVDNFEGACYRLLTDQVLYGADKRSRVDYRLIETYERDFGEVLELIGVALVVNRRLRYAAAIPKHTKNAPAPLEETLVSLVLLLIYDRAMREGAHSELEEVEVDLVALEEEFRQSTGRNFPRESKLDSIMKALKRWGIARTSDESEAMDEVSADQPYMVIIRPAIRDVLGETALQRLGLWKEAGAATEQEPAEEEAAS